MAVVLDAFASYLQDMLTEMTREEVDMLLGVSGEIDNLGVKLGDLKNSLADAERRRITDQSVQGWVRELKGTMYDATDILDLCQLRAMERGPSAAADIGCFNPLLFCLRNLLFAHDIGSRIKALNQRLGVIKKRSAAFSFVNLGSYEERSSRVHAASRLAANRETTGVLDRWGVVGEKIEEDTRKLVQMLTRIEGETSREDNKMMVLAVVGLGGIGKTTLAQNIFNDDTIQREFDKKIWLSVHQEYNEAELLRRAITEAGGDHRRFGDAKVMLQRTLKDALYRQKTLLVMDDVWSEQAWEAVLKTPLINAVAEGSRVLVTTRHDTVAQGMKAREPYHRVGTLGPDDAWLLLKKQVVSSELDEPTVDMLKDIGMEIIARCDGVPLAIKVMGGLLSKREKQRRDWEKVLNDSIWSVSEMPYELNYAIYLSYEDLPPYLKQCFLHYSILPKNTVFSVDEIIGMWISEGFVHGNSDELGTEFYKQLILRNLIEPDTRYVDQWVCIMHDVVRSFAQYMARDETLVAHSGETDIISKLSSQKFLRLSIESKESESDELEWTFLHAQKSLRTLISIGYIKIKPGDSLIALSRLRTLHIESANVATLIDSLYQLKHLRYLSLQETDISRLPENINKMKFLQYISLRGCKRLVKFPNGIVKLGQLSYLGLRGTSINSIPRGFCGLTDLRKLHGFQAHVDGDWCSLEELGPLSKLTLLGLEGLENISVASSAAKARLGEKVHLCILYLRCTNRLGDDGLVKEEEGISEEEQRQIEEVFDELYPPPCLDYLDIRGYFGRRLPMWMMSTAVVPLVSLRILMMGDLTFCTQLPDGLCQLPYLQFLHISRAPAIERVGSEFLQQLYHHHSHHSSSQAMVAFPRLHKMNLVEMVEWKEWEWEEQVQAMPILEELLIINCKLRSVPPGLASHARALKRLNIYNVQHLNSLENFASLIELEVHENPDLESITNLPKLQKLDIRCCPKLKVLKGMLALQRLELWGFDMETLPGYLQDVNPRHFLLECSLVLLSSIAEGKSSLEWERLSHIQHVKAYTHDGDNQRKWYVLYTRDPYNLETNISRFSILEDDDVLVGIDIPCGSAAAICKDDDELVGADSPSESAVALRKDDSELVGVDSPREELIKLLMDGEEACMRELKVVSILGMGGLGKTTIANAVYGKIKNKFDCHAFVSVPPKPNELKIVGSIIFSQVDGPDVSFEEHGTDQEQIDNLKQFLQHKRFLIVIDDIWNKSVWDFMEPALRSNNHGSRIVATTRRVDVAEHIGGVYELQHLSYSDSKKLFYGRTFGGEDNCPSLYRELSERILIKCGQLPLAIIAISSLLANKLMGFDEWRKVCYSIGSGLDIGDSMEDVRKVLSRSYDDLHQDLKNCLLYLSIFPEDYKIRRDCLVQRWITEGFVPGEHVDNLQELGESYFYKLVDTGMIQPIEFDTVGKALACCVPVIMLDLVVYLSKKENFVTILSGQQRTANVLREVQRLSLQVSNEQHVVSKATHVTSLSIFCRAHSMTLLSKFQKLRVLDLESGDSLENQHLIGLEKLLQLRYLAIGGKNITEIPEKVGNLRFLETLDLTATSVEELPCTICKLRKLRCLLINRSTKVPDEIQKLRALEELADMGIRNSPNILEHICTMPELRVLRISLSSWDKRYSKLLPEALCKLRTKKLKYLSIFTSCSLDFKSDDIQPVLEPLEKLEIRRCTFNTLPVWIGKLTNLHSLFIEVYLLEKEALQTLGGLPVLLFLSLTAKRTPAERLTATKTPEEGLTAERLVVDSDGFRRLKTFLLFNRAMGIKFEQGAMQSLERLELSFQASLTKDLCFGLENLSSLRLVQVEIVCFSATDGVVKDAEGAIRSMIGNNPKQPRPALDIRRTVEEYMVVDKKKAACEVKVEEDEKEADREVKIQEQNVTARKKSRRARRKNKRKH